MSLWRVKSILSPHWMAASRPRALGSLAGQCFRVAAYRLPSQTSSPRRVMPAPSTVLHRISSIQRHFTMNAAELKNFLADSPPSTVNLEIKKHFDALNDQQARYAHFISRFKAPCPSNDLSMTNTWNPRAAFTGTRITLRQVSPESESIFDFIIELHKSSNGDWKAVQQKAGVSDEDLQYFLQYAAQFLGNCGNYKGFGDSKFVPRCEEKAFAALASVSPKATGYYKATNGAIFSSDNSGIMHLGFPEEGNLLSIFVCCSPLQSENVSNLLEHFPRVSMLTIMSSTGHMTTYYPDSKDITKADITAVSDFLEKKGLLLVRRLHIATSRLSTWLTLNRKTLDSERTLMVALTFWSHQQSR